MRMLLADDHSLYREGLCGLLQRLSPQAEVVQAHDWENTLSVVAKYPDLALAVVDLCMPGMDPFIGLESLIATTETTPVVVVSASESPLDMRRALDAGAMGYIAKRESTPVMLNALQLVLAGGVYVPPALLQLPSGLRRARDFTLPFGLTPKQYEVLKILIQGKSNKEIARELDLSIVTVKAHVGSIFRALGVTSRAQATEAARVSGALIERPPEP